MGSDYEMKKAELKERLDKADDRILVLAKKYPIVMTIMLVVPMLVGIIIGKWAL